MDHEIMKFAEELQEFISKSEHFIQKVRQGEGNFGQRGSGSGGYYGQRGDSGGYYGQRMHNYGRREPGGDGTIVGSSHHSSLRERCRHNRMEACMLTLDGLCNTDV